MNSLSRPTTQPKYKDGYNSGPDERNPYENLSIKFRASRIYWDMGREQAKKDKEKHKEELDVV